MLWFTPQTIGGNARPVRICSIHLFLIGILSWHGMSRSQGTLNKSSLWQVDLVQVTTLFCCDWHGISSHSSSSWWWWFVMLHSPISLLICCLPLLREKEKAAATKLEVDIWPSSSLVLDGRSSLEQRAQALRGTLWWVNSYMRDFQTLNRIQGTSSNKGFSSYPQVVLRENCSLAFYFLKGRIVWQRWGFGVCIIKARHDESDVLASVLCAL